MAHLLIAYDLGVILIGVMALVMTGFWVVKIGEIDLRNFWILYACFTFLLIVMMLKKYLSVNVADSHHSPICFKKERPATGRSFHFAIDSFILPPNIQLP